MTQLTTTKRKQMFARGFQMLVIGIMLNLGITIIAFLAFIQFSWMIITNDKDTFIADLGASFRFWYDKAITFLLGASEDKPFPWHKAQCNWQIVSSHPENPRVLQRRYTYNVHPPYGPRPTPSIKAYQLGCQRSVDAHPGNVEMLSCGSFTYAILKELLYIFNSSFMTVSNGYLT